MVSFEINQQIGQKVSKEWVKKIIQRVLKKTKKKIKSKISIAIVDGPTIKRLNKVYRGKNNVTDVLSFKFKEAGLLGEIIICYSQSKKQAGKHSHSIKKEIEILLVHGMLHLLGYDHEKRKDAARMERMMNLIVMRNA